MKEKKTSITQAAIPLLIILTAAGFSSSVQAQDKELDEELDVMTADELYSHFRHDYYSCQDEGCRRRVDRLYLYIGEHRHQEMVKAREKKIEDNRAKSTL